MSATRTKLNTHRIAAIVTAAALAVTAVFASTQTSSASDRSHPGVTTRTALNASSSHVKPTIVLVHGAWADPSSFAPVATKLLKAGYTVLNENNPLHSLHYDARYLVSFLDQRTTGPVILVGHSYGGAVITDAATSVPRVKALVYVDAFVPAQGESVFDLTASAGGPPPSQLFDSVNYPGAPKGAVDLYFKTNLFPSVFANGLPAAEGQELAVSQSPVSSLTLTQKSSTPAWKTLPSWYVLGTEDHVIVPSLEKRMADRAGSHIVKVAAGHLSMLTHPGLVTRVIETAARLKG